MEPGEKHIDSERNDADAVVDLIRQMDDVGMMSLKLFEGKQMVDEDGTVIKYRLSDGAVFTENDEGQKIIVLEGTSNIEEIRDRMGTGQFTFFVESQGGYRPIWVDSYLDAQSFPLMRSILANNKDNHLLASRLSTLFSFKLDDNGKPAFDKLIPAVPILSTPGMPEPSNSTSTFLLNKEGETYKQYWREEILVRLDPSDIELLAIRVQEIRDIVQNHLPPGKQT